MVRSDLTPNSPNNTFVQMTELEVECVEHTFTHDSIQTREYKKIHTAVCDETGNWSLTECSYPVCEPIEVDSDTVAVTELLITDNATTQGSTLKFSCKEDTDEFEFTSSVMRVLAVCNRK